MSQRSDVLPSTCLVCRKTWREGDEVQQIPRPMIVKRGLKSGVLGLYEHPNHHDTNEDVLHHPDCCYQYFDPEGNPHIYDQLLESVEQDIGKSLRQDLREEMQEKMDRIIGAGARKETLPNLCKDCWQDLYDEDPLMCIFCKKDECVMELRKRAMTYYFCMQCRKWWDQAENDLNPEITA